MGRTSPSRSPSHPSLCTLHPSRTLCIYFITFLISPTLPFSLSCVLNKKGIRNIRETSTSVLSTLFLHPSSIFAKSHNLSWPPSSPSCHRFYWGKWGHKSPACPTHPSCKLVLSHCYYQLLNFCLWNRNPFQLSSDELRDSENAAPGFSSLLLWNTTASRMDRDLRRGELGAKKGCF